MIDNMNDPPGQAWEHPATPPQEFFPGPSNPWAACAGGGGSANEKFSIDANEILESGLKPICNQRAFEAGAIVSIGGFVIGLIGSLATLLAAAARFASMPLAGPLGFLIGIALVAAFVAHVLLATGIAAMASSIDPPTNKYKERATQPQRRKVNWPDFLPAKLIALLEAFVEMEHLATGQMDVVDRARSAAAQKDEKSYQMHVKDLWTIQTRMNVAAQNASQALRLFAQEFDGTLKEIKLDQKPSAREMITTLSENRRHLEGMGLNPGEINSLNFSLRVPSPVIKAVEGEAYKIVDRSRGSVESLILIVADLLDTTDFIEWEAYGGKPK